MFIPCKGNDRIVHVIQLTWDGFESVFVPLDDISTLYPVYAGTETFRVPVSEETMNFIGAKINIINTLALRWSHWFICAACTGMGEFPSLTCSSTISWIVFDRILPTPNELYQHIIDTYPRMTTYDQPRKRHNVPKT